MSTKVLIMIIVLLLLGTNSLVYYAMDRKVRDLMVENNVLRSDIKVLTRENESLKHQVNMLESEKARLSSIIEDLNSQISSLNAEVAKLRSEVRRGRSFTFMTTGVMLVIWAHEFILNNHRILIGVNGSVEGSRLEVYIDGVRRYLTNGLPLIPIESELFFNMYIVWSNITVVPLSDNQYLLRVKVYSITKWPSETRHIVAIEDWVKYSVKCIDWSKTIEF